MTQPCLLVASAPQIDLQAFIKAARGLAGQRLLGQPAVCVWSWAPDYFQKELRSFITATKRPHGRTERGAAKSVSFFAPRCLCPPPFLGSPCFHGYTGNGNKQLWKHIFLHLDVSDFKQLNINQCFSNLKQLQNDCSLFLWFPCFCNFSKITWKPCMSDLDPLNAEAWSADRWRSLLVTSRLFLVLWHRMPTVQGFLDLLLITCATTAETPPLGVWN